MRYREGRVEAYFSRRADFYQRLYSGRVSRCADSWWRVLRAYQCGALELLGDLRGKRVMEIGCGVGALAVAMALRGAQVSAIDLSPRMVEIARRNAAFRSVDDRVRFEVLDFDSWEPPDSTRYDWIVAITVFDYAASADSWLSRIASTCDGFIATFPGAKPTQVFLRRLNAILRGGVPVRFYDLDRVSGALRDAGFEVQDEIKFHSSSLIRAKSLVRE